MKNLLLIILFTLPGATLSAQNSNDKKNTVTAPAEASNAFHKDFPTAKGEEWEKEGSSYEVNFKIDDIAMSVEYSKTGYRKSVERQIEEGKLPANVFEYIKKNYPGYKLKDITQTITDKSVITYETEINKGSDTVTLLFDINGKFKKKEK